MKNKPFALKELRIILEWRSMHSGATVLHNSRGCHLHCGLSIYLKELSDNVC